MELMIRGQENAPTLLLIPAKGMPAEALYAPLQELEKTYRLILADGAGSAADLEKLLLAQGLDRLSGAYGLREGGTLLLALLAGGRVRVRTAVTEGPFALPRKGLFPETGNIVCWRGGKDKKAKKSLDALRKVRPSVSSHVLGKLKSGQDFVSICPDRMVARIRATFGSAVIVTAASSLPQDVGKVWAQIHAPETSFPLVPPADIVSERREDYTLVREGSTKTVPVWSHMTRLRPVAGEATECLDQVEVDAGKLRAAAVPLTKLFLARDRKNRRRELRSRS